MKRRMWALTATTLLAGWANAQSPKALPAMNVPVPEAGKDAAPEPGIMTLRTAGQPDRKVIVLKSTKTEDGRVLTEVKDVATGETMLVADKAPGRKTDSVASIATQASAPTTLAADMKSKPTTLISSVNTQASTSTSTTSTTPKAKNRIVDPLLSDATTSKTASSKTLKMPSAVAPSAFPTPMPQVAVAKTPELLPASAVSKTGNAMHVILPVGYIPAEVRMKEETASHVATLQSASRPTVRQDAATALAEGRFGSAMEVKSILAMAAMHDPAPVVRAHCITCLSNLGYSSPDYVGYLRQCSFDVDHGVKMAASQAMSKLEPKK